MLNYPGESTFTAYVGACTTTVWEHFEAGGAEVRAEFATPKGFPIDDEPLRDALESHGFRLDQFDTMRHVELSKMPREVLPSGIRRSA